MSVELGMFVAEVARTAAREEARRVMAGIAAYGVAAANPVADPDLPGRQVVDVTIGNVTWPAVPVRFGEIIAAGDPVLVLQFGQESTRGWLVLRA